MKNYNEEIVKGIGLLLSPGLIYEVRCPQYGPDGDVAAGLFNDFELLAADLEKLSGNCAGVFVTINPIGDTSWYGGELNKMYKTSKATDPTSSLRLTQDSNILRRLWFLVDIDSAHPVGQSATDDEVAAAWEIALRMMKWLRKELGFPLPITIASGNGWHLRYQTDLPNDAESKELIRECLRALGEKFNCESATVDPAMANASRIAKFPGTLSAKGEATTDRPHRLAHIVNASRLGEVTPFHLAALAALASPKPEMPAGTSTGDELGKKLELWSKLSDEFEFAASDISRDWDSPGYFVKCPGAMDGGWPGDGEHADVGLGERSMCFVKDGIFCFSCMHSACEERSGQPKKTFGDLEAYFDDLLFEAGGVEMVEPEEEGITQTEEAKPAEQEPPISTVDPSPGTSAEPQATPPIEIATFKDMAIPRIRMPGKRDGIILSQTAAGLGDALKDYPLFNHLGKPSLIGKDGMECIEPDAFRTWAEIHTTLYRQMPTKEGSVEYPDTMTGYEARGILASPQFKGRLRPIVRFNTVRLPIWIGGELALLPNGYDAPSSTYTADTLSYDSEIAIGDAKDVIDDYLGEFTFSDAGRSKSVSVAALLGMYCAQLLPLDSPRPAFIITKNAEGSGATTLVACCTYPVLGYVPTGTMPADQEEMRKRITSAVMACSTVLFFDNVHKTMKSEPLEAFLTSPVWTDRRMGGNAIVSGPNIATVFLTSNGATCSSDMRRRSLFVELHMDEELASQRKFKRALTSTALRGLRPRVLAACWAFTKAWDALGRPKPSISNPAFPEWSQVIGGIVQAMGYGCALEEASVADIADRDADDMHVLASKMTRGHGYTMGELKVLAREHGCFDGLVGEWETDVKKYAALGYLLKKYDGRQISGNKFHLGGRGHSKRFWVGQLRSDIDDATINPDDI